jgi:DNA-binding response OmpR family regulator
MNASPITICSALRRDTRPDPPEGSRPGPQSPHPAEGNKASGSPQRSLHILCIDDDESILEMMRDCLSHYGHRVRIASGGKHGIELFCTAMLKSEPCDVVITDLGMPDTDGFQVARTIKAESPGTPIIMMTGESRTMKPGGAADSDVDIVVGKPPRIEELNALLLRITAPMG